VVVVSQRPGPSTGLPTRTSQGDLAFVLNAGHDDFPRALLAPGTPDQGYLLGAKALDLAERYQTPVFILTDQYFGDTHLTLTTQDFPALAPPPASPRGATGADYQRYTSTEDGVSPRRYPGFGPEIVVGDSDEHTPDGHLTEDLGVRVRMHQKRLAKLRGLYRDMGNITATGDPDLPLVIMTWGSSYGAAAEAVARLKTAGTVARLIHLAELWPFPRRAVAETLQNCRKLIVVEANATGQMNRLLRQETGLAADHLVVRYDGLPFTPEYILRHLAGEV
jgi:2-oxoglutarate/2-oxoacid ferredoxin oxidoreductase subunit alpha